MEIYTKITKDNSLRNYLISGVRLKYFTSINQGFPYCAYLRICNNFHSKINANLIVIRIYRIIAIKIILSLCNYSHTICIESVCKDDLGILYRRRHPFLFSSKVMLSGV
jgi:hypothetical protein